MTREIVSYYADFFRKGLLENRSGLDDFRCFFGYSFCDDDLSELSDYCIAALHRLPAPVCHVNAAGKSRNKLLHSMGFDARNHCENWDRLSVSIETNKTIYVIENISKSTLSDKIGQVRSFLKIVNDFGIGESQVPAGNFLFLDRASFLEKGWSSFGRLLYIFRHKNSLDLWCEMSGSPPTVKGIE